MNSDELRQFLEKIEKRLIRMEKNPEKMKEELEGIRMENRRVKDSFLKPLRMQQDWTLLSMECIIGYLDPNKRLLLSYFSPQLRNIEKRVHLKVSTLEIQNSSIQIDSTVYSFKNEKTICGFKENQDETPFSVTVSNTSWNSPSKCEDALLKVIFALFAGRNQFKVTYFQTTIRFPFQLRIDAHYFFVYPKIGFVAENYCNTFKRVTKVMFSEIERPDDLRLPWVQDIKQVEFITGNSRLLLDELPNLQVMTLTVYLARDSELCIDFIIKWCEKRENREYGMSAMFTFYETYEESVFTAVLTSPRLSDLGFQFIEHERYHLPFVDNLGAVLTVQENKRFFSHSFKHAIKFRRHLYLAFQQLME